MNMQVIGKKKLNFTSKEGRVVDGTSVYLAYEEDDVEGMITEKFFIPSVKLLFSDFRVGDILNISFTRKGKIDSVSLVMEDDTEINLD